MPDFDVDFCMEGRDRVIDYVAERYGRKAVSQIVTFGSMAAKAVVRDVTRVQGKPYGLGDRLAKLIPFEVGMTLDKAFDAEPQLKEWVETDEEVREVWDMALKPFCSTFGWTSLFQKSECTRFVKRWFEPQASFTQHPAWIESTFCFADFSAASIACICCRMSMQ